MKCKILSDGGYDPGTFTPGETCAYRGGDYRGVYVLSNTTYEWLFMFNHEVEM